MTNFINYAHRGASAYAPENTFVSFRKGVELGANGIELDLQRTKDNKIVIFHDKLIDKKSNGTGEIKDYTYEELKNLDFGSWFDKKYSGEHIVLFEDFAKEFLNKDLTFAIKLKVIGIEKEVLDIINKYKKHDNIYISSFEFEALKNVRKLDGNIKLSYLVDNIDIEKISEILSINGNQICPNANNISKSDIELGRKNGLSIRLWGIKNEEVMNKVYNLDIDGMTVNFPDKLNQLLESNTMKVYIVRHGQVNHNLLGLYDREDEDLNETGINQVKGLREKVENLDYDIIISSPLIRAKHTANIINVKNRNIIIDEKLKERDPGSLSGHPIEVTNREEYWNYYTTIKYGTSEDIQLFFKRIYEFLDDLKTKDYKKVLVVAHSGVSKAFNAYFEGIQDGKFLNRGLKNCEIREYELHKY